MTSIGPISRSAIWRTLIVLVAAALLSACGTSRTSLPPVKVTAVPSSSINTPLLVGSCALQQCWVAGSADVQGVSSTLVERQLTSGEWTTVTAPSAAGSLTAMACSTTTCVVGGALAGQDLLWTAPTATATLTAQTIALGTGVRDVSCDATTCFALDATTSGTFRLVNVSDLTATPASGLPVGAVVTAFSCSSATQCWVASTSRGTATVYATSNGASWAPIATPSWTAVQSLACASSCIALVQGSTSQFIARDTSTGWTTTRVPFTANALSCVSARRCVVVGQHDNGEGAGIVWHPGQLRPLIIHYAPTPFTQVGCGTTTCVAVGATTILSLRP